MDYGIIGGIIVLVILIIAVFVGLRKSSSKKEATAFLESLGDEILKIVLDTINNSSPEKYHDIAEFEADLVENIYSEVWDFVAHEADSAAEVDSITKTIFKLVDKKFVVNFIDQIIENNGIYSDMTDKYAAYNIENSNIEEEDKALETEYSDQNSYVENSTDENLEPAKEPVHTEEEIAALNPQHDDDEEFDPEDDSMEVITDKKEIITATDKNGNTLYYEIDIDGKKKRVTKAYALENMK